MQFVSSGAQTLKEVRVSLCLTLNNFTKSFWKNAVRYNEVAQVALTLYTPVFDVAQGSHGGRWQPHSIHVTQNNSFCCTDTRSGLQFDYS